MLQASLDEILLISGETAFWHAINVRDSADINQIEASNYNSGATLSRIGNDAWSILDMPLIWHADNRKYALINACFFSNLKIIDLTDLDGPSTIGLAYRALLENWTGGQIFHFLLTSSLLRTFVHSHAQLQMTDKTEGDKYCECYSARHFMYTNEEIRTDYKFRLEINTQTGAIVALPM